MTNRRPRVGLLLLYLKLYDETLPGMREQFGPFIKEVGDAFAAAGIELFISEVCRLESEFTKATAAFEEKDVDLIVTLHLAYSPSLEAVPALIRATAPILMLDTTMDGSFGRSVAPERILYNHGIHGVQDLASMLRRNRRPFRIVAGHCRESRVIQRAADIAGAALAAKVFRKARVLRIGERFKSMGDFDVDERTLRSELGIAVDQITPADLTGDVDSVSDGEVDAEMKLDLSRFDAKLDKNVHQRSVRIGLGLRRRLEEGGYSALTMNFLAFDSDKEPVNTVPFLEASKAMERGVGYGGEGDALTAALVGALSAGFGGTTFTEIFCPDWKDDGLFLSHMGEINPTVIDGKPLLVEKPFPFTAALNPAIVTGCVAAGPATFVNIVPGPEDSFDLIVSAVDMLEDSDRADMREVIRGWMRHPLGVARFLEEYSRAGGTHHSALVRGDKAEAMEAFAQFAGIGCRRI